MKLLLYTSVLVLQVGLFEPKSTLNDGRNYPVKRRRFKDVLQEAKKIAVDDYVNDYVNMMVGTGKRGTVKNDRDKDFLDLLEDFEVLMYSRKLQTLLRQRCIDWWCSGDKATEMTTAGAAAAETTGPEPTGTQAATQAATQTVLTTKPTTMTTSTTQPTTTTVPTTTTTTEPTTTTTTVPTTTPTTTEPTTTTTTEPTTITTTEPTPMTTTTEPTTTATTGGEETIGDSAAVTETAEPTSAIEDGDIFSVPRWRWRLWLWRWLRWHARNGWRSRYGWLRRRTKH